MQVLSLPHKNTSWLEAAFKSGPLLFWSKLPFFSGILTQVQILAWWRNSLNISKYLVLISLITWLTVHNAYLTFKNKTECKGVFIMKLATLVSKVTVKWLFLLFGLLIFRMNMIVAGLNVPTAGHKTFFPLFPSNSQSELLLEQLLLPVWLSPFKCTEITYGFLQRTGQFGISLTTNT